MPRSDVQLKDILEDSLNDPLNFYYFSLKKSINYFNLNDSV